MDKAFKIAAILTAHDKMSQVVNAVVNNATNKISKLEKVGRNFGNISEKAMLAGGAATDFFSETITAAEESEVAQARLRQVFKSMKQDVAAASKQSEEYASKLQFQIGVEDEVIMAVQAKIATFEKASNAQARANGVFERATKAAFDMQAAGFGDAEQNSVQLGKALQDPIQGINALRRSGISFTAAEKLKIKALVATGQTFKAQHVIMKAIEKQVGGVAKATATSTQKMKIGWGEVKEKIGGALMPSYQDLINKLNNEIIPAVMDFTSKHPEAVKWIGIASASLFALGVTAKVVGFAVSGLSSVLSVLSTVMQFVGKSLMAVGRAMLANPILLVIAAIAVAVFLIIKYWQPIKEWFLKLWEKIKNAFSAAWEWIKKMFLNYTPYGLIIKHWKTIKEWFSKVWEKVKVVFSATWEWIKKMFLNYTPYGLIIKHWDSIKEWFTGLWEKVKGVFNGFVDWISNLGSKFFEAGKNIVNSIWQGIKALINKPIEAIEGMVQKIRNFLPFSPAKEGPLKTLHKVRIMETIAGTITAKPIIGAMQNATNQVAGYKGSAQLQTVSRNINGGGIHITYAPNIQGGATADLRALLKQHSKELKDIINEEVRRQQVRQHR